MMVRGFIIRLVLCVLCLGVIAPVTGWAAQQRIERVEWSGLGNLDPARLADVSGLRIDAPLDPAVVRRAIYALSGVAEIRQVAVRVSSISPDRVVVTVAVERVSYLQTLTIVGAKKMTSEKVVRAARLIAGDEVDDEVLDAAARRVRALYAQHGFFAAEVSFAATLGERLDRVTVSVVIQEGQRARISRISYPGYPGLVVGDALVGMRLAQQSGKRFDASQLKDDLEKIEQRLASQGYLHPRVGPYRLQPDGRAVEIVVPVVVRDRIRVTVTGNRHMRTARVLEVLDLVHQRSLDERALAAARQRLLGRLVDDGFRRAQVELTAHYDPESGFHDIQLMIVEGRLHRADQVRFEGNRSLTVDTLSTLVAPSWRFRSEPVREKQIIDRAATLEGAFRGIGFPDATVTYTIQAGVKKPHRSVVTYHIDEGRRWWFDGGQLRGIDGLDGTLQRSLRESLSNLARGPFRRSHLRDIRAKLTEVLGSFGYVDAEVTAETRNTASWTGHVGPGGAPIRQEKVEVIFDVAPGPQVRVGAVSLSGTFRTRSYVVLREVAIKEGGLYTPDLVAETRHRLFRIASFDLVRITTKNANAAGTVRDVDIHLIEGKPGTVELGAGYGESDGIRGLVDLSYRDLFRRGHRGGIRLRAGQLRRLVALTYALPWVGPFRANLTTRLFYEEEELISFDRETRAAEASIRPPIGDDLVLTITYRLEFNRFPRLPEDQVATLAGRRRINVGSILTSLVRDTRDDPFRPRRGSVFGVSYEQGARALGSEIQFGKATAQMAGYTVTSRHTVLAAKFQTGRVRRLFESVEVPVSERFFVGGQSTLRGYALDSVGVPGETLISGVPQGGEVLILANLELRLWGQEGLGMVLFADAGNVWSQGGTIGLDDVRLGVGPGLHYATPVGPIRLDLGYKVDRRKGEDPYRIHFTLGHSF